MFIVKKAVTPFLLPPGIFVAVLILAGAGLLARRRVKTGVFSLVLAGMMWLCGIGPVSDALLRPLETGFPIPDNPKGDVIVLLCGGIAAEAPDLSGIGAPSPETLARLVTAVRLHRRLHIPVIVSGGMVFGRKPAEATVAGRFLKDLGVGDENLKIEARSRDTFENARYATGICRVEGYRRPILVTSALHLRRAVWCFEKNGMPVLPVPADVRSARRKPYVWVDYLPSGYREVSAALREYLGLVYYRLVY